MSIFTEYDKRFCGLEKKVGWFVFLALLALLIVLGLVAFKQQLFARTTTLYAQTSDATGLYEGMAVNLMGFKIGKLEQVNIDEQAAIRVKLAIHTNYLPLIPLGSTIHLTGKTLFEDGMLKIVPAEGQHTPTKANSTLPFLREPGIGELAGKLAKQIEPVLKDVHRVTASINDPDGDIQQILHQLHQTTSQLEQTRSRLDVVLDHAQTKIDRVGLKFETVLDSSQRVMIQVDHVLPGALNKINHSLEQVEAATTDLRRLSASSLQTLPPLLQDSRIMAQDGREMIDSAKKSWPIHSLIEAPENKVLPYDSYEAGL